MPDRRSSGISAVPASSITPPMAIQLMLLRGSKLPTNSLVLAFGSVQRSPERTFRYAGKCPLRAKADIIQLFDAQGSAENLGARLTIQRRAPLPPNGCD